MFLKQAFALVALLATTGILAAPSPYENKDSEGPKGVKGYDFDHKGYDFDHKGYDFDHKGIEYRGNHKPAYPYNFCGWGYKYYGHEKECRVERCPSGKAFWDKEKKCNDKPKYLGRMDEAEAMYQRALQGYEKAIKPENLSTYVPALNTMWGFASLCDRQHQVEDARAWYSKALLGYEIVVGTGHPNCQRLRSSLADLGAEEDEVNPSQATLLVQKETFEAPPASTNAEGAKSVPKRHRLLSTEEQIIT
ncbi:hypothetical protein DM02DRAFT_635247 [Periconia macrospinosa]|uniref:Tetratricopeptide repeat domain-containing protein n=1 Tax=Periconia macrospinosa TaxID=97972 RepID=A0A2V1D5P8_9PLEO|nr:hypothetical protein DM02DRAFT_635247 [Periconia macrospinosa]